MHSYGVRCDAEVLDMLDTAERQLEVQAGVVSVLDRHPIPFQAN
jgi:hypothetical protein